MKVSLKLNSAIQLDKALRADMPSQPAKWLNRERESEREDGSFTSERRLFARKIKESVD